MEIRFIYEQLYEAGLVRSQMDFSAVWLGRSDRYFSHLLATQREPGLATLSALLIRLERMLMSVSAASTCHAIVAALAAELSANIQRRAICDHRRHRRGLDVQILQQVSDR